MRVCVYGAYIEMSIVFVNHIRLITLSKFWLPLNPVSLSPFPVRLAHFPISADGRMAWAFCMVTVKGITEYVGNLF